MFASQSRDLQCVSALQKVIASTDPFDDPKFDPVDYINKRFTNGRLPNHLPQSISLSTEESLSQLDPFVVEMQTTARQLDDDIYSAVREQAECQKEAKGDIDTVKEAVQDLFKRIVHMRTKAAESEKMVQGTPEHYRTHLIVHFMQRYA